MNIELLIGPTMIIPDDQVTLYQSFGGVILRSDIECHFVIDSWNDLVLDVRVGEGEFLIGLALDFIA